MTDPMTQQETQLALEVPAAPARSPMGEWCQKCGAPPGEPCVTANGERASREHAVRRRATAFRPVHSE